MKLLIGMLVMVGAAWGQTCSANPVISSPAAVALSSTSVQVTWTTDCLSETKASNSGAGGDTPLYNTAWTDLGGTLSHSVTFTGLLPSSTYLVWGASIKPGDPTKWAAFANGVSVTTSAPPGGAYDFDYSIDGGTHVDQGKTLYITMSGWLTQGTLLNNSTQIQFGGIPTNTTLVFGDTLGCSYAYNQGTNQVTNLYNITCSVNIGIATAANTPVGDYTFTVTYKTTGGSPVDKTKNWTVHVQAPTTFKTWTPTAYPPIPCLTSSSVESDGSTPCPYNWQSTAVTDGQKWCTDDTFGNEQHVWYYDATRVYYSLKNWDTLHGVTGNPSQWDACINFQADGYAGYVNGGCAVPAIRVFAPGLATAFKNSGTASYSAAVNCLTQGANQPYKDLNDSALIVKNFFRESAYRADTELTYIQMTGDISRIATLKKGLDIQLARVDQLALHDYYPYMIGGLIPESLINCYESSVCPYYQDPRIPAAVKTMADTIWANDWNLPGQEQSFVYAYGQYDMGYYTSNYRALNLLIAPTFAWLFKVTGDATYQVRADAIFQGGVTNDPGAGPDWSGKNYSQSYRTSFDFVNWRSAPPYDPTVVRRLISGKATLAGKSQ